MSPCRPHHKAPLRGAALTRRACRTTCACTGRASKTRSRSHERVDVAALVYGRPEDPRQSAAGEDRHHRRDDGSRAVHRQPESITVTALPVAHRWRTRGRWSRLVLVSSSSLATCKESLQGAPPARIFARKMDLLSAAQKFLPLRGADGMGLAAQETFLTGMRAQKSGCKSVLAQNRRGPSRWSRKSRCDRARTVLAARWAPAY